MIPLLYRCAEESLQPLRKAAGKRLPAHVSGEYLLRQRHPWISWAGAGQHSANGFCHLWPTGDDKWLALNLSRESDWSTLPALFQTDETFIALEQVAQAVRRHSAQELESRGRELGLALALATRCHETAFAPTFRATDGGVKRDSSRTAPRVLDLSSLWAGPLCSFLLQACGAEVTKVESRQRPDGARVNPHPGAQQFWQELNAGKQLKQLDFHKAADVETLRHWIREADIVIEGSRPRALRQLDIDAERLVAESPGKIWISITGYGRQPPQENWIAFGDDAAVAAGLCQWKDAVPCFIGDAIADPLTGIAAARAGWDYWQAGKSALLDINLFGVARATAQQIRNVSCT